MQSPHSNFDVAAWAFKNPTAERPLNVRVNIKLGKDPYLCDEVVNTHFIMSAPRIGNELGIVLLSIGRDFR